MNDLLTLILGPLYGPECRRALARGWIILVRCLAGAAVFFVAMVAYWWWTLNLGWNSYFKQTYEIPTALTIVEGMMLTIAMVLGPAVMAGSLAGEKERGVLALLLTTRVRSREIVTGRLVGKLAQVGMILLACVPALAWLAGMKGIGVVDFLIYLILPISVAIGGGGLAALASTLSRRGRDALLSVYLIDLFFMLTPLAKMFGVAPGAMDWVAALNPFVGLSALVYADQPKLSWISSGIWLSIGVLGVAVASWRLRPSCLAPLDGDRISRRSKRPYFVPPINEDKPMLWKELFIERVGTLGRFGKWAGIFLVVMMGGGSLVLTVMMVADVFGVGSYKLADWSRYQLESWIGGSGTFITCLIQWAIGIRAAVSISSERERGTWDALLTSPLDANSIVLAKLWGSLHALRWLVISAFVAWILGAATEAISIDTAVRWGLDVLFVGAFMAAVGVRTSLTAPTATRAMSITIGIWLGAWVASIFFAGLLTAVFALLVNAVLLATNQAGNYRAAAAVVMPFIFRFGWPAAIYLTYLAATVLIVVDTRVRFDRLAGRMTEGNFAVAVDDLIHGRPVDEFLPESSPMPLGAEPRARG